MALKSAQRIAGAVEVGFLLTETEAEDVVATSGGEAGGSRDRSDSSGSK
jgi:hypothetical protein